MLPVGYSLKYGTTQPHDLVQRAAEFEMPALALTDRDGLAGAIRFTQSCVDYGIAPIIGVNCAIDLGDSKGSYHITGAQRWRMALAMQINDIANDDK